MHNSGLNGLVSTLNVTNDFKGWTCICMVLYSLLITQSAFTLHVNIHPFTHIHTLMAGCQPAHQKRKLIHIPIEHIGRNWGFSVFLAQRHLHDMQLRGGGN